MRRHRRSHTGIGLGDYLIAAPPRYAARRWQPSTCATSHVRRTSSPVPAARAAQLTPGFDHGLQVGEAVDHGVGLTLGGPRCQSGTVLCGTNTARMPTAFARGCRRRRGRRRTRPSGSATRRQPARRGRPRRAAWSRGSRTCRRRRRSGPAPRPARCARARRGQIVLDRMRCGCLTRNHPNRPHVRVGQRVRLPPRVVARPEVISHRLAACRTLSSVALLCSSRDRPTPRPRRPSFWARSASPLAASHDSATSIVCHGVSVPPNRR